VTDLDDEALDVFDESSRTIHAVNVERSESGGRVTLGPRMSRLGRRSQKALGFAYA
jgi:hypothetical protein